MQYTLTCQNNSEMDTQFYVFQRFKKDINAVSLVWMCQSCAQDVATRFQWSDTPYFIWGFAQTLKQGETIFTSQSIPINEGKNVRLSKRSGDSFSFESVPSVSGSGTPLIITDGTVTAGTLAVGLGMRAECMCGTGALVVTAGPNFQYAFHGGVEYYLAHTPARNLKLGDVLDSSLMSGAVQLTFSPTCPDLTAELDESNMFHILKPRFRANQF